MHFAMIETLIRDAEVLPVRVFSGFHEGRWSNGAETVPRRNADKSVASIKR
jgi:hypothetical protein